jgi:hypothetical protein
VPTSALLSASQNLDAAPKHPDNVSAGELQQVCTMYIELMNTHPKLEIDFVEKSIRHIALVPGIYGD